MIKPPPTHPPIPTPHPMAYISVTCCMVSVSLTNYPYSQPDEPHYAKVRKAGNSH